jgi:hypothetical protein
MFEPLEEALAPIDQPCGVSVIGVTSSSNETDPEARHGPRRDVTRRAVTLRAAP